MITGEAGKYAAPGLDIRSFRPNLELAIIVRSGRPRQSQKAALFIGAIEPRTGGVWEGVCVGVWACGGLTYYLSGLAIAASLNPLLT